MATLKPVQAKERIFEIDAVRGLAIFGILVVNMIYFSWPFYGELAGMELWDTTADRLVEAGIRFFAGGKFITMFSLLFGLGFSMFISRAQEKGRPVVPLFTRRLLVLLLIGLVHTVFLWVHDVLVYFALTGFILLVFRRRESRTLLVWAAVFLAVPIVVTLAGISLGAFVQASPEAAAGMEGELEAQRARFEQLYEQAFAAYSSGTFLEVTRQRLVDFGVEFFGGFLGSSLFLIAPMFLTGLWFGRSNMFRDAAAHVDSWHRLLRTAAPIGIAGSLLFVWAHTTGDALTLSWKSLALVVGTYAGAPALSLTYVALVVLTVRTRFGRRAFEPVACVGRLALSNYLFQSLICTTLFYGYGFGLFGEIGPAVGLVLTVGIYVVQLFLSSLYLQRFRYGPAEFVWRKLTYRAV